MFQSTRPRGARRGGYTQSVPKEGFNPRAHAGRDCSHPVIFVLLNRFNPRAHAGRDVQGIPGRQRHQGFNPRAHAGRDLLSIHYANHHQSFNPRAHAGRDCRLLNNTNIGQIFHLFAKVHFFKEHLLVRNEITVISFVFTLLTYRQFCVRFG